MAVRAMIFGELTFPPRQAAVWRGLQADPLARGWPDFLVGRESASTVVEVLDACSELNDIAGPSFFFLADADDLVRVRAWFEAEHFEAYGKRLASAFERAHLLGATGELLMVDAEDRRGIRVTLNGAAVVDSVSLYGQLEDAYASELAEVFELSRSKMFGPSAVLIAAPRSVPPPPLESAPLLEGLEFVHEGLFVSYRGSLDAQQLDFAVSLHTPVLPARAVHAMTLVVDAINLGAAGGAHFPPWAGHAEALDGFRPRRTKTTELAFSINVAGVAPAFLRNVIELLREAGDIEQLSVNGSLPLDDTELSVQEHVLAGWLADTDAYPEAWLRPGFDVGRGAAPKRGRSLVSVELLGAPQARTKAAFEKLVTTWLGIIATYVGRDGRPVDPAKARPQVTIEASGKHLHVFLDGFPFAPAPAEAILVNMLAGFHARTAKVAKVGLALGG